MRKSLQEMAKSLSEQPTLMENREKGDMESLINITTTVNDFDFLTGDDGDYVVFTVKEDTHRFYFGGGVATDQFKKLEDSGYKEDIQREGLPVRFEKKKSKNGRYYSNPVFYPGA